MPGVGVGRVLTDDWNVPDKHIGQYCYSHKTKPYTIELTGYKVTLLNHITGKYVTTSKETEFEVLQVIAKMASFPRAAIKEEIEL